MRRISNGSCRCFGSEFISLEWRWFWLITDVAKLDIHADVIMRRHSKSDKFECCEQNGFGDVHTHSTTSRCSSSSSSVYRDGSCRRLRDVATAAMMDEVLLDYLILACLSFLLIVHLVVISCLTLSFLCVQ